MNIDESLNTAPIIGAAIAGTCTLIGVIIANWWNAINHRKNHELSVKHSLMSTKATKKEELFLSMFRWHKDVSNIYLYHLHRYSKKVNMTYMEVNKLINEKYGKDPSNFDSISMLISIYFPELKTDFELIMNVRHCLVKFLDENGPKNFTFDEFSTEQECFDAVCESFLHKLAEL